MRAFGLGNALSASALLVLFLGLAHCAGTEDSEKAGAAGSGAAGPCFGPGCGAGTGGGGGGGGAGATDAGLPPEKELESSFRSPVATGRFVWTANPDSGRVALVDALSLQVRVFEAGFGPTHLAAVPTPPGSTTRRAIVLNVKSHDATFFEADAAGNVSPKTVEVHADANSWAISGGGRFALAWTDATKIAKKDPTEGFQDVTIIDLSPSQPVSTRVSVGYRPTRVFIASDEMAAYIVTEPGISVVDLSGATPFVDKEVPVTDDPLENPASRDVTVTPNGAYALVRRDGSPDVGIVTLADGTRATVTLSGPVTDLDLSEDGTRAVAVVRAPTPATTGGDAGSDAGAVDAAAEAGAMTEGGTAEGGTTEGGTTEGGTTEGGTDGGDAAAPPPPPPPALPSEVFVLPIPAAATDPGAVDQVTIGKETVGSVALSADGAVGVLYTNATPNDRVTLLRLAPGVDYLGTRTVALKAPVTAAFPAADGAHAIVLLTPTTGSKKGAFAIVPIEKNLPPKIVGTDAPPVGVAIAPAPSTRAVVTTRYDVQKLYATHLLRMPELTEDRIVLPSAPLATGMVPDANVAFIAQEHPEGRLTFVALDAGSAKTLTGFELGSKVVD